MKKAIQWLRRCQSAAAFPLAILLSTPALAALPTPTAPSTAPSAGDWLGLIKGYIKDGAIVMGLAVAAAAFVWAAWSAIAKFNAQNKDLERALQEHKQRCPRESEDKTLVESCNAMAAGLQSVAQQLEQERPRLQVRQQELKARIEQHNAARRDWAMRKRDHEARVQADGQHLRSIEPARVTLLVQHIEGILRRRLGVLVVADERAAGIG